MALSPDVLRALESEVLTNGHGALPEGLVLPEGWTLTPLHRVEDLASALATVRGGPPSLGTAVRVGEDGNAPTSEPGEAASSTATNADVPGGEPSSLQQDVPSAPSRASPPILATTNASTPVAIPPFPTPVEEQVPDISPSMHRPASSASSAPALSATAPASEPASDTPWQAENPAWNFAPADAPKCAESVEAAEPVVSDPSEENTSYTGKGKGRAVEVEEVEDKDA